MHTSALFLSIASTALAIVVHPPLGMYSISSTALELIDHSHKDPFAAAAGLDQSRRLMVSVFEPTGLSGSCGHLTQRYMPPATSTVYDDMYGSFGLPSGFFDSLELSLCQYQNQRFGVSDDVSLPVVIFSPGLGNSRLIYSGMAQSLASQGYAVVAVDHPYDAAIVEYPDGTYVLAANISTPEQITFDLSVRVRDVSFVLDRIHSLFGSSSTHLDFGRFVMYGHSLGGATAVATMSSDPRIVGAIDLDGSLWGQVVSHAAQCPVLLFAHEGKNLTTDPSWQDFWSNTTNTTKVELQLHNSTEGSFTDFPLLAQVLGGGHIPKSLQNLIGQLPGTTVDEVLNSYMGHFFKFVLGQRPLPVLKNDLKASSQVTILEQVVKGRCTTNSAGRSRLANFVVDDVRRPHWR